jgi:4-hydroxy-tetrahydrodipicolinate synthase
MVSYVRRFSEKSSLPVFLYNVPQYAHNEFAPETVHRLSHLPNVFGLKNSNGSLEYLSAVRQATAHRPEFSLLVGNEETLLPALLAGAHGGVCGGANMFPELYVGLYEAVSKAHYSEAEALHELVVRVTDAVYTLGPSQSSYLCGLKCALSLLQMIENVLAEPLQSFGDSEHAELHERFNQVRLAIADSLAR